MTNDGLIAENERLREALEEAAKYIEYWKEITCGRFRDRGGHCEISTELFKKCQEALRRAGRKE